MNNKNQFVEAEKQGRKLTRKLLKYLSIKKYWFTTRKYECCDLIINDKNFQGLVEIKCHTQYQGPRGGQWCLIQLDKYYKLYKNALNIGCKAYYLHIYKRNDIFIFYLFDLMQENLLKLPIDQIDCPYQTMGNNKRVIKEIKRLPIQFAQIYEIN